MEQEVEWLLNGVEMIYLGSCHCEKIKFQIEAKKIYENIYKCNCTLCKKKSILMKAVHKNFFTLLTGVKFLNSYKWNKRIAEHFFCNVCGVYTHHKRRRDPNQICVNFACLENVDLPNNSIIEIVDGASHD